MENLTISKEVSVLFVDDETSILNSLRRRFRKTGWNISTAENGPDGLEIMQQRKIDVVVSDMKMPEMSGAEFLTEVADTYPKTVRILMTGYSDIESAIEAINKGRIFGYISKPWNDEDLLKTIERGLEITFLERERDELLVISQKQNEKLKNYNLDLENEVSRRTEELEQTASFLDTTLNELKSAYNSTIDVFASLIELREGKRAGHAKRVAQYAKDIATSLGISEHGTNDIYLAALLHNIGLIGMPDHILSSAYSELSFTEQKKYREHPIFGEASLMSIPPLYKAAKFIRQHCEYEDGSGFPDGLVGAEIEIGAKIIGIISKYDEYKLGFITGQQESDDAAVRYLIKNSNTKFNKKVVDVFLKNIKPNYKREAMYQPSIIDKGISTKVIKEGMVLAQDLVTPGGVLLLVKGQKITGEIIARVRMLERDTKKSFVIYIRHEE